MDLATLTSESLNLPNKPQPFHIKVHILQQPSYPVTTDVSQKSTRMALCTPAADLFHFIFFIFAALTIETLMICLWGKGHSEDKWETLLFRQDLLRESMDVRLFQ